jgi:hypothetical protein
MICGWMRKLAGMRLRITPWMVGNLISYSRNFFQILAAASNARHQPSATAIDSESCVIAGRVHAVLGITSGFTSTLRHSHFWACPPARAAP